IDGFRSQFSHFRGLSSHTCFSGPVEFFFTSGRKDSYPCVPPQFSMPPAKRKWYLQTTEVAPDAPNLQESNVYVSAEKRVFCPVFAEGSGKFVYAGCRVKTVNGS